MYSFRGLVCLFAACLAQFAVASSSSGTSAAGVIDALAPTFSGLAAVPSDAVANDEVTITFSASETLLSDPTVLVNGRAAVYSGGGKSLDYTFVYTVSPTDPNGNALIQIVGNDALGNPGMATSSALLSISGNVDAVPLAWWPALLAMLAAGVVALRRRRATAVLALLAGIAVSSMAQPVVSNVAFMQRPGGAGGSEVVVSYDLVSPEGPCSVSLALSEDGGSSFDYVPESVSGDVGHNIAPGIGKQIIWDVSSDISDRMINGAVFRVTADDGVCETCLPWSDPATWGGVKPVAGEDVEIPSGVDIVLDEDPPALGGLLINGHLEFGRANRSLSAKWIMVHGSLAIGSEAVPFGQNAVVTLTGDDPDESIMDMGTRGIMVMGGSLEMHGVPTAVPWTKINQNANAGTTALTLDRVVDWGLGDEIVLAPTNFYGTSETEHFNIAGIAGLQLTTSAPLAASRWGVLQYPTNSGMSLSPSGTVTPPLPNTPLALDERAEIANLSRNIVVQAPDDALWQTEGFGVHVMIMDTGASAHLDGVEIRRGGQRGRLGRYPFHWHRLSYDATTFLGDATGQYIRNSTINQSQNRGIVIHATNGVTVANNVVYDARGHAIFTEDAVERRNVITGNITLHTRNPQAGSELKQHEIFENGGSSGYWIANPDNTVTSNTAADSQGHGFWLAFPNNPWGASIGVVMRPNRLLFGEFSGNTVHTSGFEGLMIDFVEIDNLGNVAPFQYTSTTDGVEPTWDSGTRTRFTISDITTWKNGRGGIWDRVVWPDLVRIVSADNCGRFFAGSGADGLIERCLIVGTSLNNPTPRPAIHYPDALGGDETPTAFATYHSTFDIRDNIIVNFPLVPGERSGAFATEDYYIRPVDKGQMRNTDNRLVGTHPGYRSMRVQNHYTLAGALWDPHGTWGPANNYFVYDDPFFTYGQTVSAVEPAGQTGGVSVPGPFYGIMEFVLNNERPYYEPLMEIEATRLDPATLAPVGTWTVDEALSISWILAPMRHFAAHRDGIYELDFPSEPLPTDVEVRFENMLEESDTLVLGVQFSGAVTPNAVYTIAPGSGPSVRIYSAVGSLQEVRDSAGQTFWQDTANNRVWVKLQGGSWQFWDQSGLYAVPTSDELLYESTILHINTD